MRDVYLRLEPALDVAMGTPDDTRGSLEVHERTLTALRSGDDGAVVRSSLPAGLSRGRGAHPHLPTKRR